MRWSIKGERIRAIRLLLVVGVFLLLSKNTAPNINKTISTTPTEPITVEVDKSMAVETKAEPKKAKAVKVKPKPAIAERKTYPSGCELYRSEVAKYGWNVNVAMAVMQAESGCNPNAANWNDSHNICTGSFGLFQISCHSGQVYEPRKNIAIAWQKYVARGWQPWGVCTNGTVRCY